jgi:glycosyltransferase involved in cell wall biosynthesis
MEDRTDVQQCRQAVTLIVRFRSTLQEVIVLAHESQDNFHAAHVEAIGCGDPGGNCCNITRGASLGWSMVAVNQRSPLVSVVMPVFRPNPRHLAESVDSVLAQSFADWELVIVEDPSDRTGRAVLAERNDPRIRYLCNPERTGLARQHNRAVAEARGALIARFDADDVCEPDRLEKQVAYLAQRPDVHVLASQLRIIDGEGAVVGSRYYPTEHAEIVRAMHSYNPISGSNVMFRREVVDRIGGWREDVDRPAQDYEWYSRAAVHGFHFAVHADRLVRYRRHAEQIKSRKLRGTILTTLEVKRKYWLRSMGPAAMMRLGGEAMLLVLPAGVVLWLLRLLSYSRD